jgi:hypothetical protein
MWTSRETGFRKKEQQLKKSWSGSKLCYVKRIIRMTVLVAAIE